MATITSSKHIEFIRLVAIGSNYDEAYTLTSSNKNLTKATARVEGSKLAKRYALEIQQAKEKAADIVTAAHDSDIVKNALKSVLTQSEVDAILCKIISGEQFEIQTLMASGKILKAKVTPTITERRAAVETYNKRFGSNIDVKKQIEIDGEIKTTDFSALTFEQLLKLSNASKTD